MGYHYTEALRVYDPHALHDVEVFHQDEDTDEPVGFYYAFGQPGCLRDSEPMGPFRSEAEALGAAREVAGFCSHGRGDVCKECPAPILWALVADDGRYITFGAGGEPLREGSPLSYSCAVSRAACWKTEQQARETALDGFKRGWCSKKVAAVRLSDEEARCWGR